MSNAALVRYRTHPQDARANQELVAAVFAELEATRPEGLRYACVRVSEVEFVHLVVLAGGADPLAASPAFAAFQQDLGTRLVAPPERAAATLVGSYWYAGE
jgi:hypothetical protein